MHVRPTARLPVQHRRPGVAVRFQPRPRCLLERVQHRLDLRIRRRIIRGPRDHPRRVPVLELQGVGDRRHLVRIPAKHLDARARLAERITLAHQIRSRRRRRARAPRQELDVHQESGPPRRDSDRNSRSIATRCAITATASAAD